MPQPRSLFTPLRNAKPEHVDRFLAERGCELNGEWTKSSPKKQFEIAKRAITAAEQSVKQRIETDLYDVELVADPEGPKWLADAARLLGETDYFEAVKDSQNLHDQSLTSLLDYASVFELAAQYGHAEILRRTQSWYDRSDVPNDIELSALFGTAHLESELSRYFRDLDGRGDCCESEIVHRGATTYVFVYLTGHTDNIREFNDDRLVTRLRKPVFDVLFAYDKVDGVLSTWARGGKSVIQAVQEIFGDTVLNIDLPRMGAPKPRYSLDPILEDGFDFAIHHGDGIERVELALLRCRVDSRPHRRITFEGDVNSAANDTLLMIDRYLNHETLAKEKLVPLRAEIRVRFASPFLGRRKVLMINVGVPNTCNLRNEPEEIRARGESLLDRWGLRID